MVEYFGKKKLHIADQQQEYGGPFLNKSRIWRTTFRQKQNMVEPFKTKAEFAEPIFNKT